MASAQFDALARRSLHLRKAKAIVDYQLLLVGSQAHQALPHILAHSAWAWLTQHRNEAHIAHDPTNHRPLVLLDHAHSIVHAAMHRVGGVWHPR